MARKPNRTPLIAFGMVSVLVLAAGGAWIAADVGRKASEDKAVAGAVPVLPAGRLQLVSASMGEVRYLALDEIRRGPDGAVGATVLLVGPTATSLEGKVPLVVRHETIDCAGQRLFEGRIGIFDIHGKLTAATNGYSGKLGRPATPQDGEVAVACAANPTPGHVVLGARAAQRETQAMPDEVVTRAEADPKNADAWAWLCAAGARGRWRKQTPQDCAHALDLRPTDTAVRLDRGFLFLALGRRGPADADFQKVIAEEPANMTALYGYALILALNGNEAASRPARAKALAADPELPRRLELAYRFLISNPYRKG